MNIEFLSTVAVITPDTASSLYRFNTHRTASDLRIHEISYAAR
jgi:hypothetical protein